MAQIERAPFEAKRRLIDISGDGDDNNIGREVTEARDDAIAKGVTVNGFVVLDETLLSEDGSPYQTTELERYYRENVIGGPGAFVLVARDFTAFGKVILNKLIAEISGLPLTKPQLIMSQRTSARRHAECPGSPASSSPRRTPPTQNQILQAFHELLAGNKDTPRFSPLRAEKSGFCRSIEIGIAAPTLLPQAFADQAGDARRFGGGLCDASGRRA